MKTFQDLVQEALKTIPEIDIFQLKEKIDNKKVIKLIDIREDREWVCLLYTSPSPRDTG